MKRECLNRLKKLYLGIVDKNSNTGHCCCNLLMKIEYFFLDGSKRHAFHSVLLFVMFICCYNESTCILKKGSSKIYNIKNIVK